MPHSNLRFTAAARLSAALLLAACVSAPASQPVSTAVAYRPRATDALAARIQERIAQLPGAVIGLAYIDLASGDTLYLNADDTFHAASTMKVPVMIELFRAFDAGRLRPDQRLVLGNQFKSIVDGSPYTMGGANGADSLLHRRIGTDVPVIELIEAMITRSSNLATNTLIELVGATNANATAHALGARNIRVLRGVSDNKAFEAGLSNTTTARDLAVLMEAIQRNRAASPASSATMREILLRQEFNGEIPAGLPPGTPIAHKTGWISGVLHDAAIVYPIGRAPYVLVLLSRDIRENDVARPLLVDLSRLVYQHATGVSP